MCRKTAICLNFIFFFAVALLRAQSMYAPDQLLIKFDKSAGPEFIDELQNDLGAVDAGYSSFSQTYLWTILDPFPFITESGVVLENIIEALEFTQGKAKVDEVDLNYQSSATPLGSGFFLPPVLPSEYNPIMGCDLYPGNLYQNQSYLTPLKIAIIDTGIDALSHPALFDGRISQSFNFINHSPNAADNNGHGTQVAGIVAGMAVAEDLPNVSFFNLKALDHNGTGTLFDIIQAVDFAIFNGANIINCSFGYEPAGADHFSNLFHWLLQEASNRNILILTSAGNRTLNLDQHKYYPAGFSDIPNLITVAASTCDGGVAGFTNFGPLSVELAAPGVGIICPTLDGQWVAKTGTSFSTPIVTGIAMQLACREPLFNASRVRNGIMAQTIFSNEFQDLVISDGLANIFSLMGSPGTWVKNDNGPIKDNGQFQIFPNPFSAEFTLSWVNEGPAKQVVISLKDLMNRPVWQYNQVIEEGTNLIPVSPGHLPSGYYIVEMSDGMKTIRHKVLRTADGGR